MCKKQKYISALLNISQGALSKRLQRVNDGLEADLKSCKRSSRTLKVSS